MTVAASGRGGSHRERCLHRVRKKVRVKKYRERMVPDSYGGSRLKRSGSDSMQVCESQPSQKIHLARRADCWKRALEEPGRQRGRAGDIHANRRRCRILCQPAALPQGSSSISGGILETHPLANPWSKKNPFMSMWLSSANAVAARSRSAAKAAVARQQSLAIKQTARAWADVWLPTTKPKKRR